MILQILFWLVFLVIFYVYFGYPVLMGLLAVFSARKVLKDDGHMPAVTMIIAAYNEGKVIGAKLDNTLELDYPADSLEVIVFSDASEDDTDGIVKSYEDRGIKLLRVEGRKGKTCCQNAAVSKARNGILVFSDANSFYQKDALKKLVRNFADSRIGCVGGELRYRASRGQGEAEGEGLYWRYETLIKKLESRVNSLIGASGAIYALRKHLYEPLPGDIISDFVEPLEILKKGYRVVYEDEAVCYEVLTPDYRSEFARKVRIINRSLRGIWFSRALMNPFRFGLTSFQLAGHKLLKWLAPFFLITLFILNGAVLLLPFYCALFALQILFYLSALLGFYLDKRGFALGPLNIPYFFCIMNLAALAAVLKTLTGKKDTVWSTQR